MKIFLYAVIVLAFMLITFFGLGPVFLADGSTGERILTLLGVILLYILLGWLIVKIRKSKR